MEAGASSSAAQSESSGSNSSEASNAKRSDVWKYFEKIQDRKKALCKLCDKELAYRGRTTNLREHLKSKHSLTYKAPCSSQAATGRQQMLSSLGAKPRRCSETWSREITDKIATMIALDLRPISIVECEGFKDLIASLEPGYNMPSRKHFSGVIRRKFEVATKKLHDVLAKDANRISLTTDIWTSGATEAYSTVTAHYISAKWNLQSVVLETTAFPECHTAQAIADKLKEVTSRYDVSGKVLAVVHDQAANIQCSLDILSSDLGWESVHCNAHCLQLCLKAGLSITSFDRLMGASRKLVGHFKHRVVATEALKERQAHMNVPQKKLIQEIATRWNSSYYMLERLLELRWPVSAVLSDETITKRGDRYLDLKSEQWVLAEEVVKILHPFEVATTFLSYEEHVSISCVLPVLHGLLDSLKHHDSDQQVIQQFKVKVAEEMKRRWALDSPDLSSSLVLSAAVDPRFKHLKFLKEEEITSLKEVLIERMDSFTTPSQQAAVVPGTTKKTALDVLLGEEDGTTTGSSVKDELEKFFTEPLAPRKDSPLTWWRGNGHRFPQLATLARAVLSIPAISTPSERVFSTTGLTVSKLRSCLKPKNVDALVFLNKNLKQLET